MQWRVASPAFIPGASYALRHPLGLQEFFSTYLCDADADRLHWLWRKRT